jgi:hypothetical protein
MAARGKIFPQYNKYDPKDLDTRRLTLYASAAGVSYWRCVDCRNPVSGNLSYTKTPYAFNWHRFAADIQSLERF